MRFLGVILLCFAAIGCSHKVLPAADSASDSASNAPVDSVISILDSKLDEYLSQMTYLTPEEKSQECDFLMSAVSDSIVRNHVAVHLYEKYSTSNLMGDEAVAIYLTDNWFVPGKVSFEDYASLATARIFADFNRQSLLGMRVPELVALTPDGTPANVLPSDGRLKVLFIFDTTCATCKLETALLEEYFSSYNGANGFDFIAFYAGADAASWEQWRNSHFTSLAKEKADGKVTISHYWDPEGESDFQRKFGVLSTPKIFLIDEEGLIVGRRLDSQALARLLQVYDLE